MFWLLLNSLLFLFLWSAGAAVTNRTIDDTTGDSVTGNRPIYLPATPGVWEDATCKGCAIQPEKNRAFKGTWNAATYNPDLGSMSIELSFKGTAVYVFFILANNVAPGITTETACNFTLDGRIAGTFNHTPSTSLDFEYNALVYSNPTLQNIDHKLLISTSGVDHDIFVNFDYAIYTVDDTPTPSPPLPITTRSTSSATTRSTSKTTTSQQSQTQETNPTSSNGKSGSKIQVGAIVGGVIGGLVALVALILLLIFCRRRQRTRTHIDDELPPHPMAAPSFSTGYHSNRSNAPFATVAPIITRYRDRPETHSDFLQSGTIARSSFDTAARSPFSDPTQDGVYPPSTSHDRSTLANHNIMATLPTGEIIMSAHTAGQNSISSSSSVRALPSIPLRTGATAADDQNTEAVRKARQMELVRQMRAVKQEMRDLKTDLTAETVRRPSVDSRRTRGENVEMEQMKEQMRVMKEQIEYLRAQQQSEWAQGLSDEPPPGYSARSPSH